MVTKQADTTDNKFSGGGNENPYAATGGGVPSDPQMQNSQGFQGIGGGDLPASSPMNADDSDPNGSNPAMKAQQQQAQAAYVVGCLECGNQAVLPRVTASLHCKCGSADLVFEAADWTQSEDSDGSEFADFAPGVTGYVVSLKPDFDKWSWALEHNFNVVAQGVVDNKSQAQSLVEATAPIVTPTSKAASKVAWRTLAGDKPPWLDDKKKDGGDDKPKAKKDGDNPFAKDDADAAPAAPAPAADPSVAGQDDEAAAMDQAQATLDQAVGNLATLGHDAKEIKYDVDALLSEWRCVNCGLEGQANISDDGQTDLQGDLFTDQNPCAAPANPAEDPNAQAPPVQPQPPGAPPVPPAAVPPAPAAPAAPGAPAPATPPAQPAPPDPEEEKKKSFPPKKSMVVTSESHPPYYIREDGGKFKVVDSIGETRGTFDSKDAAREQQKALYANVSGAAEKAKEEHGDTPADVSDVGKKAEKISVIVEGVLATNPGMNEESARKIATLTVERYPSVIGA